MALQQLESQPARGLPRPAIWSGYSPLTVPYWQAKPESPL